MRSITDRQGSGHLTLTGSYTSAADVPVSCALADTALEISLTAPSRQKVVLHVPALAASGKYASEVRVIVTDPSEGGFRQSEGKTTAEITVEPAPSSVTPGPRERRQVSGSFQASYTGEAGKGTVAAQFKDCIFELGEETLKR